MDTAIKLKKFSDGEWGWRFVLIDIDDEQDAANGIAPTREAALEAACAAREKYEAKIEKEKA